MSSFFLLIKPASADCNLRCKYCFYIDHLENVSKSPRMSDEVLERTIASYMRTNQNNNYSFGWQGGEPTLLGLKFFKRAIELQKKYAPPGSVISNGLQTNGTLITDEMARFFAEYNFLLGVSLDGPPYIHDYYRKTIGQKPTHSLVMRGIERLKQHKVEFNILILVNDQNVKKAGEIYQYFREKGFFYHQYIPCVEYDENNNPQPYSITGEEWGNFLCELFDQWIKEDINRISIRHFDSILEYLVHGCYNVCHIGKDCCQYFVVEHDGNVYPCDFYVQKDLLLGNVMTDTWEEFLNSPVYRQFGRQKTEWHIKCNSCPFIDFCHGDCQKFRVGEFQSSKVLSVLCQGWKRFYTRTLPRFDAIANKIRIEHDIKPTVQVVPKKIGRNELCPCGSGKKYKLCCLK